MSTAPITMPTDLQALCKNIGFSHEDRVTAAAFETDTGPDKLRMRTTRPKRYYRSPIQLNDDQRDDFEEFFEVTCEGGTKPFNFTDPRDGIEKVVVFRNASMPTFNNETPGPLGSKTYTATLILEIVYNAS